MENDCVAVGKIYDLRKRLQNGYNLRVTNARSDFQ